MLYRFNGCFYSSWSYSRPRGPIRIPTEERTADWIPLRCRRMWFAFREPSRKRLPPRLLANYFLMRLQLSQHPTNGDRCAPNFCLFAKNPIILIREYLLRARAVFRIGIIRFNVFIATRERNGLDSFFTSHKSRLLK